MTESHPYIHPALHPLHIEITARRNQSYLFSAQPACIDWDATAFRQLLWATIRTITNFLSTNVDLRTLHQIETSLWQVDKDQETLRAWSSSTPSFQVNEDDALDSSESEATLNIIVRHSGKDGVTFSPSIRDFTNEFGTEITESLLHCLLKLCVSLQPHQEWGLPFLLAVRYSCSMLREYARPFVYAISGGVNPDSDELDLAGRAIKRVDWMLWPGSLPAQVVLSAFDGDATRESMAMATAGRFFTFHDNGDLFGIDIRTEHGARCAIPIAHGVSARDELLPRLPGTEIRPASLIELLELMDNYPFAEPICEFEWCDGELKRAFHTPGQFRQRILLLCGALSDLILKGIV